jgi:hypothetical protein
MAHRVILLLRGDLVAFGVKRTFSHRPARSGQAAAIPLSAGEPLDIFEALGQHPA